ncbi:MgtC/SapB family protein, partial [Aeromonas salmonicida]|uniref:MgtC/SapB family protein n=2 Tax=Aeromonas salmonicida TaxID=645 RepID=UPI0031E199A6
MWQEIWKTVLSEFADIQDIQQMTQIVLRLLVAGLLGGLLGYEREQKGKSAGIRTHMLVSIGAALFVLIGVVAQISQQIMISPAPSDRYTRGFLT